MDNYSEWRKLSVCRNTEYESLVEKLCSTKNSSSDETVFSTIKDFMVFAALVGFQLDLYRPLESNMNKISIILETYASTNHDSYIYLMALSKKPSLDTLKDENLREAISIFEAYCNGGLEYIGRWIFSNVGKDIGSDILFNQTLEYLIDNE
ncbi:hypothetical protein [Photobacterium damselae]|uniref:Uncharacterized protein n=1 Tax=Photobacterium damselae TaxID=38293 RepID=A0ABD6X4M7_PHODM|nr:hypothetical protein [Photobacterium damselae]KAB1516090.1 hypothetical protein FD717_007420 [Photobacterium damselae subsp. damselae]OBU40709.1 hypothetical protein AYY27_08700 [Photobacterium damselae]PSU16717.1 hypothetical protein CTM90_11600 [Photobacterium damselae]UKA28713.1 hypothetical protein IPQ37_11730 [Photobacterium damselae subsp. damselae]